MFNRLLNLILLALAAPHRHPVTFRRPPIAAVKAQPAPAVVRPVAKPIRVRVAA